MERVDLVSRKKATKCSIKQQKLKKSIISKYVAYALHIGYSLHIALGFYWDV